MKIFSTTPSTISSAVFLRPPIYIEELKLYRTLQLILPPFIRPSLPLPLTHRSPLSLIFISFSPSPCRNTPFYSLPQPRPSFCRKQQPMNHSHLYWEFLSIAKLFAAGGQKIRQHLQAGSEQGLAKAGFEEAAMSLKQDAMGVQIEASLAPFWCSLGPVLAETISAVGGSFPV